MDFSENMSILPPNQGVLMSTGGNIPIEDFLTGENWGIKPNTIEMNKAEDEIEQLKQEMEKLKETIEIMGINEKEMQKIKETNKILEMDNTILRKESERSRT